MILGEFKKLLILCGYPQNGQGGGGGAGLRALGILKQSAVPASVTGTLSETTLATIAIPAGAMGVNGAFTVRGLISMTNNANSKTIRGRFSGGAGLSFFVANSLGSTASMLFETTVWNRNSQSSQVAMGGGVNAGLGTSGSAVTSMSVDTSQATSIVISGTLGNTADTITLEGYTVELLNP